MVANVDDDVIGGAYDGMKDGAVVQNTIRLSCDGA